jgi:diguanylate cyclase (GGDEF)-like protein
MDGQNIRFGIGRRIAVLVSIAVTVTVLCVAGILATYQANQNAVAKRTAVESTAYVFASAVADHVESRQAHEIRTVLRSIDRVPGIISASVYSAKGTLIASLGHRAILLSDMASSDPGFWEMMRSGTVNVSVDIIKSGSPVGVLVVATDITDLRSSFFSTMGAVLIASLLASLLGVALSVPLQRRITRPITTLTESMRQIRESRNYTTKINAGGNDETGVMVEAFNSLITDIRFRDDSLQKLAYFDPLTGLPNRSNFQKSLEEKLKGATGGANSIAVILLNIDGFHNYNDAFGHSIGDAILMNVAAVIQEQAGPQAFTARVGGDEFAMIINDNETGELTERALARIQSAFYQPLKFLDLELHLTISAGTTLLPRDSNSVSDAMRHVDLATNMAKKLGPGRTMSFRLEMDDRVKSETDMSQGLRMAIDNKELQVHYQPQYHMTSGKVVGFEALLRWKHPTLGFVSPGIFIPLAEKSGSIVAIGDWVMEESCRQAKSWIDTSTSRRSIAVNVSPAQILQSGFVRKVGAVLARTQLPPDLLCLELTESLFLGRTLASVRVILEDLHNLGVTLALDDFGTGYSSLAYLSQLPFDKLKIDRSFVSSVHDSPRRLEILKAIIVMAHSLGMEIVAEGAETEQEILLLQNLSADQVQGYGIARPSTAEAALLTANRLEAVAEGHRSDAMAHLA